MSDLILIKKEDVFKWFENDVAHLVYKEHNQLITKLDEISSINLTAIIEGLRDNRIVMEKHLGKSLLPTEVVHHINGKRADNRVENLILFSGHAEHLKHHQRIKYKRKYYDLIWLKNELKTKKQKEIAKECGVTVQALCQFIKRNCAR